MNLRIGALIKNKEHGVCTVISSNKTGHQYDRHYEYHLLASDGSIITLDEYQIFSNEVEILGLGSKQVQ